MRIALDLRRINNPGIGRYMKCLTEAVLAQAPEHDYLLIMPPEGEGLISAAARVEKIAPPIQYYSVREQVDLPRILRRHRVDLLHSPHFNLPLIRPCPTVVTLHDVIYLACPGDMPSRAGRLYYKAMMSASARLADRIITVSEFSKADIVRLLGIDPAKIEVVHSGLSTDFRPVPDSPARRSTLARYGIDEDYILYTGIYKLRKNHAGLLRAFRALSASGVKAQLVIAGPMNEGERELRRLSTNLGVEKKVVFAGFVPEADLPSLYSGARVYACPSLYEGFGFTILEAMACGVPVVSSAETSLPEVACDAALFADARDPDEFGAALRRAFADEDLRRLLIEKGFVNHGRFTWEAAASKTLATYDRAAGREATKAVYA
jgi:glycosyltransferase involved in cell wall biosynthesis